MSARVHFVSAGPATYADLEAVPAGYTAELVNGRLHALPRPEGEHIHSASVLGRRLGAPFEDGVGGPGGWWILDEPEVHFVLNTSSRCRIWRAGGASGFPRCRRIIGFGLCPTGFARCCHLRAAITT
ncbi:protein of unknown function [Methylocaldum szegediense]|uniref:Restriction endonuclease domain-containing protein n=1 Tax=Methylocaldum szegediense TaxID=73780 RepID=A0ABM9I0Q3_9GAMM|nr:protein of unknown function [Methylocaldum szegediense]